MKWSVLFFLVLSFVVLPRGCSETVESPKPTSTPTVISTPVLEGDTVIDDVVIVNAMYQSILEWGGCLPPFQETDVVLRMLSVFSVTDGGRTILRIGAGPSVDQGYAKIRLTENPGSVNTAEVSEYEVEPGDTVSRSFRIARYGQVYLTPPLDILTYVGREETQQGPLFCFELHAQRKNITLQRERG